MEAVRSRGVPVKTHFNLSDVRGFSRLTVDAAIMITDLVEELHYTVASPFGAFQASTPGRTSGITGLVYRSIHGGYSLLGAGIDTILGRVVPLAGNAPSTPQRETVLALVNGLWGDYLEASGNPLAIEMSLRPSSPSNPIEGRSQAGLTLRKDAIQAGIPGATGRIAVLAHGLCMNDLHWSRNGHDHGEALARDLGCTPIYLHYNSGLHISTNGRRFADLLELLVREWPQPVEELVIIGHSMGGLVSRSACHYGTLAGHSWPGHLRKLIFLGTPHHGSPLERIGNWTGLLLDATPYTAPFRRFGSKRSAGITDLRYGYLLDEDWAGLDRFAHIPDNRRSVSLPPGVQCYAIAASVGTGAGNVKGRLLGDGMVPVNSALGVHKDLGHSLGIPESRQWISYNTDHASLLSRPEAYQKIREWLSS